MGFRPWRSRLRRLRCISRSSRVLAAWRATARKGLAQALSAVTRTHLPQTASWRGFGASVSELRTVANVLAQAAQRLRDAACQRGGTRKWRSDGQLWPRCLARGRTGRKPHKTNLGIQASGEDISLHRVEDEIVDPALNTALAESQPDEVLCTQFGVPMTRRMFTCLRPGGWLNDEIVNCYLKLLQTREGGPRRWCPNSFFWPKLEEEGASAVLRWARRAGVSVAGLERLVLVLHVAGGTHWAVAAALPCATPPGVHYYDSLGLPPPHDLVQRLEDWYFAALGLEGVSNSKLCWRLLETAPSGLQQNGSDCGVLALAVAERLAAGAVPANAGCISASEKRTTIFRRAIATAILQGRA